MTTRRSFGWVRQGPDPRDRYYRPARRTLNLMAPTVDLTAGMQQMLDQADLGSCGPNTADELIEFDQKAESLPVVSASRLFVYYTTRTLMGTVTEDSGVDNRTMLKAMAQYGYCPESMLPYVTSKFTQKPSQACYDAALPNRISSYAAVTQDLPTMKGTLAQGHPFMFGFDVFKQIDSDQAARTGVIADPAPGETPVGGHDVSICGYTDVQLPGIKPGNVWPAGTFRVRNHWANADGSPWGDGGYGYVSYKYASGGNASDFWVILSVAGGGVVPPPLPPGKLFSLSLPQPVAKGRTISFRPPVNVPAGRYDWVPSPADAVAEVA